MSKESSISVAVRVRPFTDSERRKLREPDEEPHIVGDASLSQKTTSSPRGIRNLLRVVDDKMLIFDPLDTNPLNQMQRRAFPNSTGRFREHRFVFDKLFDMDTNQEEVYLETTRPLLDSVLEGFNATVFAYGATGCGKTHTISGTPEDPGVIFRTMEELFHRIQKLEDEKIFDLSLSFLEIYNETIRDLMSPETPSKKLILREDAQNRISVANLSCHTPKNVNEVMEMILHGNANRTCSPTEANSVSSRSHAVLQINILQKNKTPELQEEHIFATLSVIDLAGSERAATTRNRGIRLNEGANINRSLLALGNCINALCDPRRHNHVPYRNSKLTRLLKFSLGGNCKTVMIVCVSPSSDHYDETLNTLKYANRAKEIKTKLIRNQQSLDRHVGSYLKMITQQRQEIEDLKNREKSIIAKTEAQVTADSNQCLTYLLRELEILSSLIMKESQLKMRKVYLLTKRKYFLFQKIEVENIMDQSEDQNVINLCEQIINKINTQVTQTEIQYSKQSEVDHILGERAMKIQKKLQLENKWNETHTLIFQRLVGCLREGFERQILFDSSVLLDYLIHQLPAFSIISDAKSINLILCEKLEYLVDGTFDETMEKISFEFMNEKLFDNPAKRGNLSPERQRPKKIIKSHPFGEKLKWDESYDPHVDDDSMIHVETEENNNDDNDNFNEETNANQSELDISFNPAIESPPPKDVLQDIPRLPSNIPIKSFLSRASKQQANNSKLLKKSGASRVMEPSSSFKLKLNQLGPPSKIISTVEHDEGRNVSSESEKVE